ncbi:hypothetical protein BV22DRAFT_1031935 [Leucogyrophana mollusca]|uniref:Uncharacterized protein n=1 Tax=Leucogyrophana mollusca TaxID=85980 RepID=A0ACB8BN73_9AGAM|nr:hypothetical protein BV22DRAFT_1031935 [Leucogyrophana mollusca]
MAGMFASATVFLILTMQVWMYFRRGAPQDALWIKATVAFLWIIQVVQIAMSIHMATLSMPEYDEDVQAAIKISVDWAIYVGTTSLTAFLVHVLFIRRLYILEKCLGVRWHATVFVGLVTLTAQAFAMLSVVQILTLDQSDPSRFIMLMEWTTPLWLGLVALGDILIATSLCVLLYRSRTGSPRTDRLLKRLIIFCVQTGLITSFATVVTIGIWIAAGFDIQHLLMSFPMGGIYATCLNANFLARSSYLNVNTPVEDSTTGGDGGAGTETVGSVVFTPRQSAPSNSFNDTHSSIETAHSDGPINFQEKDLGRGFVADCPHPKEFSTQV